MNLLRKLIFTVTVSCKDAAALLSERRERPLQWYERAGLRVHMGICRWCPRYNRFLLLLDDLFTPPEPAADRLGADQLSDGARARIQALLTGRRAGP